MLDNCGKEISTKGNLKVSPLSARLSQGSLLSSLLWTDASGQVSQRHTRRPCPEA
jgi:hypothetical protein